MPVGIFDFKIDITNQRPVKIHANFGGNLVKPKVT